MTSALILQFLLQAAPTLISLIDRVRADVAAGRGNVPLTQADWDELTRLGGQRSIDIYRQLGITPPPAKQ